MAIYDNDGITTYKISKIYDNDGTTNRQISKVYDNDGTTSYLVYTSDITLTNLLSTSSIGWSWSDWGYDARSSQSSTISMNSSKRYYVRYRAYVSQYYVDGSADYYSYVQGGLVNISLKDGYHSLDYTYQNIVSGISSTHLYAYLRRQYTCGSAGVNNGMVVDITELESVKGTLTAAEAFAIFGYFTGSKTITV